MKYIRFGLSWFRSRSKLILGSMIAAFLFVLLYLRYLGVIDPRVLFFFIKDYPVMAPVLYGIFYALMVASLVPTLPMNLGSGVLWGPWLGGVIAVLSAGIGASLAFFVSRYLVHDFVANKFKNRMWLRLKEEIEKSDWKIIAFTRMNPIFPFGIVSYFFGLTPVSFWRHFITTILSIIPGAFAFSFLGSAIGDIVLRSEDSNILRIILLISLGATLLVAIRIYAKRYSQFSSLASK